MTEQLKQDAARYRWLKAQENLVLKSEKGKVLWQDPDGQKYYGTYRLEVNGTVISTGFASLDMMIDAAGMIDVAQLK